jgi:hypothetical protein
MKFKLEDQQDIKSAFDFLPERIPGGIYYRTPTNLPTKLPDATGWGWTLNNKKARKTGLFAVFPDRLGQSETGIWCPEEDSNLHTLSSTST